jgi:hypothetical protein
MVVVLGDKIQMVDEPHGLLEAGMQQGARKEVRLKFGGAIHQTEPGSAERGENFDQLLGIVVGFVCLAIGEVRDDECGASSEKVFYTGHPQGLEIEQMAGVLLG